MILAILILGCFYDSSLVKYHGTYTRRGENELTQFCGILKGSGKLIYTEVWGNLSFGSTNRGGGTKRDARTGIRTCQKVPLLYLIETLKQTLRVYYKDEKIKVLEIKKFSYELEENVHKRDDSIFRLGSLRKRSAMH